MTPETIKSLMSELGKLGAAARMAKTSPEQRTEQAKAAVAKRWAGYEKKSKKPLDNTSR